MSNPLAKYSPLMIEAWRKATIETVTLPVADKAEATTLRHRLYRCRKDMKVAQHELAATTDRVTITITEQKGQFFVVMTPAENTFDEAFKAAGLTIPDAPDF